ncbi:MAG: end-binding protein Ku [Chloroflexota bacterium]|jgi:DNA end-binding protein Ku|nr:end-binding protein Ku [Chloroflexota bacterium]
MIVIPVKLYRATESKDLSFHLLHAGCGSRLRQLRWCPVHEREVPSDEVVRGYEFAKGRHVVLDDEDFAALPVPSKHTIALAAFVEAGEIDPVYYERSYYLEPDEAGLKPYALLYRAILDKGLVALGKIALQSRESLCALRPVDGAMMLETLYYPDEIRVDRPAQLPDVLVSPKELGMAESLIDLLREPFEPEKYQDEYRRALGELIAAKLEGQEIAPSPEAPTAEPIDLMAALRASVERVQREKAPAPTTTASKRRRKAG